MNPNRQNYKEAAYLMDDMLKAVEIGNRNSEGQVELTPRAKQKIYRIQNREVLGKNQVIQEK